MQEVGGQRGERAYFWENTYLQATVIQGEPEQSPNAQETRSGVYLFMRSMT